MHLLHKHFFINSSGAYFSLLVAAICFLFLCTLGPISLSIGFIDISLQSYFIMLLALCLRPLPSFVFLILYLIIGALGMPVFSGYNSGYSYLFSASAGFLYAFPLFALFFSWLVVKHKNNSFKIFIDSLIAQIGLIIIGFLWLMIQIQVPFEKITENVVWLLPGLVIKSILIALSNYVIIKGLFSAKSVD